MYLMLPKFSIFILFFSCISCNTSESNAKRLTPQAIFASIHCKPLLTTRFKSLEDFKSVVTITYDKDYSKMDSLASLHSQVTLNYQCNDYSIKRSMRSGISQQKIMNLKQHDYLTQLNIIISNPNIIRNRKELEYSYTLARRRPADFGPGDMSFYDFAETSFRSIHTPDLAFLNARDSSEKGYINTFNHITAQAIITSFFSEELADIISDLHERNNMSELTSGRFSAAQLQDTMNSPQDNYVDIINNEIGQQLGIVLKEKYDINRTTNCTPILLSNYLNDLQSFYMRTLEIGMNPYRPSDECVIRYSAKINTILSKL